MRKWDDAIMVNWGNKKRIPGKNNFQTLLGMRSFFHFPVNCHMFFCKNIFDFFY